MLLIRQLQPTGRRLAVTAWFVAYMSWPYLVGPLMNREGVDQAAFGWVVPVGIVGYLLWPVWEAAATAGRWRSFGDRARKTAISLAGALAAVLALTAVVDDGFGPGRVLHAVVVFAGMLFFFMVMPRIATGRWR